MWSLSFAPPENNKIDHELRRVCTDLDHVVTSPRPFTRVGKKLNPHFAPFPVWLGKQFLTPPYDRENVLSHTFCQCEKKGRVILRADNAFCCPWTSKDYIRGSRKLWILLCDLLSFLCGKIAQSVEQKMSGSQK